LKIIQTGLLAVILSAMLMACEQSDSTASSESSEVVSDKVSAQSKEINKFLSKTDAQPEAAKANPFNNNISGEMVETFDASSFTYVNIKTANGSIWAAGPVTKFTKGDMVSFSAKTPMSNFHSSSLNRTFDLIYFVNKFSVNGVEASSELKSNGMAGAMPHAAKQ